MKKFTTHTGRAIPMRISNIDTDQIISSAHLKRITRSGYEDALFEEWRKDPNFILNSPAYSGATILIAGANFGIGSSREHAVWALMDYGFKVVISSRFGDIFRGNSGKSGLLTIQVDQDVIEQLWNVVEGDPNTPVSVDLKERKIHCGPLSVDFQIDDYTRWRYLEGLDDVGITLSHAQEIEAFAKSRAAWLPRMTQ